MNSEPLTSQTMNCRESDSDCHSSREEGPFHGAVAIGRIGPGWIQAIRHPAGLHLLACWCEIVFKGTHLSAEL